MVAATDMCVLGVSGTLSLCLVGWHLNLSLAFPAITAGKKEWLWHYSSPRKMKLH